MQDYRIARLQLEVFDQQNKKGMISIPFKFAGSVGARQLGLMLLKQIDSVPSCLTLTFREDTMTRYLSSPLILHSN